MTSKDCGSHTHSRRKLIRRIIWSIIFILFIIFLTILLIWAILQPSKPRFILQDATVYAFNVSGNPPNLLTSNFQITLSSRNPNDKIGIYYDRLDVYATYHSQQITFRTSIPPTYQGHKEVNIWSPFVYGTSVPVAPFNAVSLDGDQDNGAVTLIIRADGRVRWKVGTFITGKYHLYVRCLAYINFGNKAAGVIVGDNAVKYTLTSSCSGHKNTTVVVTKIEGQNLVVLDDGGSAGVYSIDVKLVMSVRFRFWVVKSWKFKPKIKCNDLKVPLVSSNSTSGFKFETMECDFDFY
ncbi:unnamed protein product [Brassica rapa]|uniref:Late embryogenesis abundant protein LEA-2 subgroup domain-containing protein n=1 Tax=Brassica campestris TaxID=3711 RepID=A0A8D9H259_BRACM|nr:unnamed protein product [Brassica rapa]